MTPPPPGQKGKGKLRQPGAGSAADAPQEPRTRKRKTPEAPTSSRKRGAKISLYTIPFVYYANKNQAVKEMTDTSDVSARALLRNWGGATRETSLVSRVSSRQFTILVSSLSFRLSGC